MAAIKITKNKIIISAIAIFIVFLISLLIRLPWINRDLTEQDSLTASILRYWVIWDINGITTYKFNPVTTFPDKYLTTNKNLDYSKNNSALKDKNNNYYYTSYPPFSYIFPYIILKFLHIPRGILSLRLFSMFFHFISSFFIFLILKLLIKQNIFSLLGAIVYLFSPITLWYQGFVYMADMMVQSFWIIEIYLVSLYFLKNKKNNFILLSCIGIMNFIALYSEWLAVFFAFVIFIYAIIKIKKDKNNIIFASIIALSTFLALVLIIFQYSQISGFHNFLSHSIQKYLIRSGSEGFGQFSPFRIIIHYGKGFLPQLILLIILFFKYIIKPASTKNYGKNFINMYTKQEIFVLMLAILPALFHHIVFFQFTVVHSFSALPGAVFIALLIGILANKTINVKQINNKTKFILFPIFSILFFALSYFIFIRFYVRYDTPMDYKNIGEKIHNLSKPDQIVFLIDKDSWHPEQQLSYYAKRNFVVIDNTSDAPIWLKKEEQNKGIIFLIQKYKLYLISKIDLSKESIYF